MSSFRSCQADRVRHVRGMAPLSLEISSVEGLIFARAVDTLIPFAVQVSPRSLQQDPLLADLSALKCALLKSRARLSIRSHGLALTSDRYESLAPVLGSLEVYFDHPNRSVWAMLGRSEYYDRTLSQLREVAPLARRDGVRIGLNSTGSRSDLMKVLRLASWMRLHSVTALPLNPSESLWVELGCEADALGLILLDEVGHPRNPSLVLAGMPAGISAESSDLLGAVSLDLALQTWRTTGRVPLLIQLSSLGRITRRARPMGSVALLQSNRRRSGSRSGTPLQKTGI